LMIKVIANTFASEFKMYLQHKPPKAYVPMLKSSMVA